MTRHAPALPFAAALRAFPWVRVALAWTGVGVFFAVYTATRRFAAGDSVSFLAGVSQVGHWASWTLVTPLMVGAARQLPLVPGRRIRRVLAHFAIATGIDVFLSALNIVGSWAMLGEPERLAWGAFDAHALLRNLPIDLLVYTAAVAVTLALDGWQRAARLEAQLAQARLETLRSQLNPHFLFNALQTVSALTGPADHRARRVLRDLGDLLRLSLEPSGAHEVPLDDELGFLDRYLSIERVRFEDRLTVVVEVDDDARDALVPTLLLQPLVENAVKHGVAPHEGPVRIDLRARREGDRLTIRVSDDGGPGDGRADAAASMGIGLANVASRLRVLYGAEATLAHGPAPAGGYAVRLSLPFRTVPTDLPRPPGA